MNLGDLAALLGDHGENYDESGYYGCDCGFQCLAIEHPHHVAGIIAAKLERAA